MNDIFTKRRARLLAMKAMRDNYIPGDMLVTCSKCGREGEKKAVAGGCPSVPSAATISPSAPTTGSAPCWIPAPSGS